MRLFSFKSPPERLFYWTGLTALGESKSGHLAARTRQEARQKLRAQMIIIKKLSFAFATSRSIRAIEITAILQQLARMMQAKLPLQHALPILTAATPHPRLQGLLLQIQHDLKEGMSLAESLAHHPRWFNPMVCALVQLGESTAGLPTVLEKIADQQHKVHGLKQQLKLLSLYPLMVLVLATLVTLYLLITVLPQIQTFFQNAHQPLPTSTLILLKLSHGLHRYGGFIGTAAFIFIGYSRMIYQRGTGLKHYVDKTITRLPFFGKMYTTLALAQGFQVLTLAQETGLKLIEGLQFAASTVHHAGYRQAFLTIREALVRGESIHHALLNTGLFPELVQQFIRLGEDSGTLSVQIKDLDRYYSQIVDDHLQRLNRCIEPILMLILGCIIGGLILCLYLPMIQLGAIL